MAKRITEEMRAYDALPFMDDLFNPTLEALHAHGGSATNAQIETHVRSQFEIGPRHRRTTQCEERVGFQAGLD